MENLPLFFYFKNRKIYPLILLLSRTIGNIIFLNILTGRPGGQFPETTSGPFCKGIFRGTSFAQPSPEGCSGPGTDRSSESQRRSEVSVPAKESRQTEVCLCLTPYISFGSCAEAAKSVLCNEGLRTVIRAVNLAG